MPENWTTCKFYVTLSNAYFKQAKTPRAAERMERTSRFTSFKPFEAESPSRSGKGDGFQF